ncbi:hypothetical protein NLM31_20995 [Bradyrhizobium sp. CCGUVB4N]|uniref:hypothetical protein n=1 Tax=Bradyrhizobium sp. CCGUVB4N TaxID=2949631 RepID=UPI0020B34E3C|nr:hypothetical protein [Bradyrhizobium sp. CCGUVB4N]MCP3382847.1 hypothetical protein [Bradyrhizobium sp. CCGUVB4N]
MSERNVRPLDKIADDIARLERKSIFDIGDLLLEARAQCERGEWIVFLEQLGWSWDSAHRYAAVAELAAKFRNLRNLKLPATILYDLAYREKDVDLPSIVDELAKHASKRPMTIVDAKRVIRVGIGRYRFGDYPDATLAQLAGEELDHVPWSEKAINALKERKPETDESASAIINEVRDEYIQQLKARVVEDDAEVDAILDGAPPDLPPPPTPSEPQRLEASTAWAEAPLFAHAVTDLRELRAKPIARFVGMFSPAELGEVADFLMAVASATKAEAA